MVTGMCGGRGADPQVLLSRPTLHRRQLSHVSGGGGEVSKGKATDVSLHGPLSGNTVINS